MVQMTPLAAVLAEKLKPQNLAGAVMARCIHAMLEVGATDKDILDMLFTGALFLARTADDREEMARTFVAASLIIRGERPEGSTDGN